MKEMVNDFDVAVNETLSLDDFAWHTPSEKFLQNKFQPISNSVVLRAINCQKFLLDRANITPNQNNIDFTEDIRSKKHYFVSDYNMCETDTRFYASVGGNNKVEIYALHTYKISSDSFSISQYLLPKGKMEDAVFIARICSHGKNGQMHINWNGDKIKEGQSHAHIITEYFQNLEQEAAKGNMHQLSQRMAYADAVAIENLSNIAECALFAEKFFNLAPLEFAVSLSSLNQNSASALMTALVKSKHEYGKQNTNPKRKNVALPVLSANNLVEKSPKIKSDNHYK